MDSDFLPLEGIFGVEDSRTLDNGEALATILSLPPTGRITRNGIANRVSSEDRGAHDWYRFVLSFPPHLVRQYVDRFGLTERSVVLDPFCGTGTTLVECKRLGVPSIGVEAHPMSHFASATKVHWNANPDSLLQSAYVIRDKALKVLNKNRLTDEPSITNEKCCHRLRTLPPDSLKLLLTNSISTLPLHKTLVLLDCIAEEGSRAHSDFLRLALAKALVSTISNLHFGPEVGVSKPKLDSPVILPWLSQVEIIARDLKNLRPFAKIPAAACLGDSRQIMSTHLGLERIDAVITSPPYPNEKDYTRTTRLESVLLGFINNKDELRRIKAGLVRSNTRSVYKFDDDHKWVAHHAEIQRIAGAIESRRIELGKTSGFERMYSRLTKLYFGGMARHLDELRKVLRPGASLAYVVGDQASYLRVMIRTGQLLAEIAESLGYTVENIDLFRTRLSTTTREQLREEVVVLKWPGKNGPGRV
jgi:DNA modification methylase